MIYFDNYINALVTDNISEDLVNIAHKISLIGSTEVIVGLTLALLIILVFSKKWQIASIFLFSVGISGMLTYLLKELIARARPENAFEIVSGYSFPSGHVTLATAFFVVLIYLMSKSRFNLSKIIFVIIALIPILIGLSRVFLNVHWATDVIGGWFVGLFSASICIFIIEKFGKKRVNL